MKVIVPLRTGRDNSELKYALRSWQKNLTFDLEVTIVGGPETPEWLKPDHFINGNNHAMPTHNVMDNILLGCLEHADEEEVLIMNDDFFVLDPVGSIVPVFRDTLDAHTLSTDQFSWWGISLRNTKRYLAERGITSPLSYELHRPCVVRPQEMADLLKEVELVDGVEAPQWRTIYGNLSDHWSEARQTRDAKTLRGTLRIGTPFISTDDLRWRSQWGRHISPLFPEPSRWEHA